MYGKTAWIESVAKTLCEIRGKPDPNLIVRLESLGKIASSEGGTKHPEEVAGTWTIELTDGTAFTFSLTYDDLNDLTGKKSAEAIQRTVMP